MGVLAAIKRVLVGKPIHTKHAHHERLPKVFALPIFASDALSSVAYATEEIMRVLMVASLGLLPLTLPVAIAIGILLIVVVSSYYQTIQNYPQGGGSYRVATENLGSIAGRVAGASLLIDYALTVAVSISAGALAVVAMAPATQPYMVEMGVGAVALVGLVNLRGAKESGVVFAVPTYTFVVLMLILIGSAFFKASGGPALPVVSTADANSMTQLAYVLLLFKAFSSGCAALTGVEAIADGVQAFKPPESKNASTTLIIMAVLLFTMFIGLSALAQSLQIVPMPIDAENFKTVVAQISAGVFGDKSVFFYALQVATAAILFLAANTAYADFPRLSSFIARDGYLPRQLASVGDRLVFQNGILVLTVIAIVLIVVFKGDTHSLVPLYAVGVFTSFTVSQAGMFAKLKRDKKPLPMLVSGFGCLVTGVVTLIILESKWRDGAWLIVVAIAFLLTLFWFIRKHYDYLSKELSLAPTDKLASVNTTALLLVPRLHRGVLQAISYAESMTSDVRAIHVTLDSKGTEQIKKDWASFEVDFPLVILDSPFRSLIEPITDYIDQAMSEDPTLMITVIVPQAVPKHWWQGLLHNNAAVALKLALASRKNVVITNVRYFLK